MEREEWAVSGVERKETAAETYEGRHWDHPMGRMGQGPIADGELSFGNGLGMGPKVGKKGSVGDRKTICRGGDGERC